MSRRVIDDRKTAAKTHHNQLKETFLETKMWHKTDKAIVLSVFCHILKKVFVHFCFLSVFCCPILSHICFLKFNYLLFLSNLLSHFCQISVNYCYISVTFLKMRDPLSTKRFCQHLWQSFTFNFAIISHIKWLSWISHGVGKPKKSKVIAF